MTTPPVDMRSTQMQMQDQLVQSQTRDIGNLAHSGKGGKTDAQKEKKLREACEGFESVFIQKMWQQMRATLPQTNMLQGKQEQYWQSMYDQELAKSMTSAGGIGLADMMYEQLSRDLVSASRTTASAMRERGGGFAVSAAPLMGQQQAADPKGTASAPGTTGTQAAALATGQGKTAGKGMDMYSGAAPQPEAPADAAATAAPATAAQGQQTAQNASPHGASPAAGQHAGQGDEESSPIVQQFLAELRQRQAQQGAQQGVQQDAQPGTIAGAQAQAAVNPASMNTAAPAAQPGVTVAQRNVRQGSGGMSRSQRAQLDAANKPANHGVMPAAQSQPQQRSARLTPPAPVPAAQGAPAAQQAAYAPTQNVQAAFVPPPGATPAQPAVPQATVTQAEAAMQSSAPVAAQAQALMTQANAPVTPPAEQQPHVINTTFTTNIPGKNRRSARPRSQRLTSGQPGIRTLSSPAPASPVAGNPASTGAAQAVTGQTGAAASPAPQVQPAHPVPQGQPAPQAATMGQGAQPAVAGTGTANAAQVMPQGRPQGIRTEG